MAYVAEVRQLWKVYRKPGTDIEVHALKNLNLAIEQGDYTAIMGASGSGKSTLMNVLGCLDQPTGGQYLLGGQDTAALDDDTLSELRSRRIGFVFQNFNLIQQLTVLENLEVPMFYLGIRPEERRTRAMRLIERVGLSDRWDHRPNQLSGGQQQRVCIARALVNNPLMLLADEPTGALDSRTGEQILAIFDELVAEGKTVLIVTHDPLVAARCRRVIRLSDGEVVEDSRTDAPAPPPAQGRGGVPEAELADRAALTRPLA
jgi:ABC-type lipoprotein export system ATPase subunit